jgi:methyl-accepting chemotaxis protein
MRTRSIRLRLTLWYITSIAALVIILGTVVYVSLRALLLRKLDDALAHGAIVLTQSLLDYGLTDKNDPLSLFDSEDLFTDEIDEEASDIGIAFAQLRLVGAGDEPAATFVARTSTLKDEPLPLSPSAYQSIRSGSHLIESVKAESAGLLRMLSLLAYDKDGRPYVLQLALSLQETRANLDSLLIGFAVSLPVLILSLSILSHVFMNRAFQPVRTMVTVAKSITAEDLSRRLDHVDSRDEIGELAGTLNGMIARLESSFNHVQQFSADVAHELKTPLARLRCNFRLPLKLEHFNLPLSGF